MAPSPRRSSRLASTPARASGGSAAKGKTRATASKSWADTAGTGERAGFLGVGGLAGLILQYAGAAALLIGSPAFAIYLCVVID